MKCLLVTTIFPPIVGGAATVYGNLHKYGDPAISVLTARYDFRNGKRIPDSLRRSERVRLIDRLVAPPVRSRNKLHSLWNFLTKDIPVHVRVLSAVLRLLRREKYDVVCIGELPWLGWLAYVLPKLTAVKVLLFVHGEELALQGDPGFLGRQRRRFLKSADGIVCVSSYTRSVLIDEYGISPDHIRLITNGVDLDAFRPKLNRGPVQSSANPETLHLFSLGRLVRRKGFDKLVEAMALVRNEYESTHLVIAGDGPLRKKLEGLRHELGLEETVTILGPVSQDEALRLYETCDVFVMPNRELENGDTEGFGLVFLEANALGKPVIGGRAGGAVDAIRDGITGLLVDGHDIEAIAEAVVRLARDGALRAVMGKQAFQWALQNGVSAKVGEFIDYCQEVMDTH